MGHGVTLEDFTWSCFWASGGRFGNGRGFWFWVLALELWTVLYGYGRNGGVRMAFTHAVSGGGWMPPYRQLTL